MQLAPHLHLLIPSASEGIQLEARLYLPGCAPTLPGYSTHTSSRPSSHTAAQRDQIAQDARGPTHVDRLIVASHPWGRLGGNMLFPVISQTLIEAARDVQTVTSQPLKMAVLSYNVRGVGHSQGSQPLVGAGEADFAAVETWGAELLRPKELFRLEFTAIGSLTNKGYSWGCISALHAPALVPEIPLRSIMLVSPALTPLRLLWWYSSFVKAVKAHLASGSTDLAARASHNAGEGIETPRTVTVVYGTSDEFTGVSNLRSFSRGFGELTGFRAVEVDGAGHFWAERENAERLLSAIRDWLER